MANHDRETTVVTSSGGGAGWFVAILLVVVVAIGGLYLYNSGSLGGAKDVNISIEAPTDIVPAAPSN